MGHFMEYDTNVGMYAFPCLNSMLACHVREAELKAS